MTLVAFDADWDISQRLALIEELSNTTRMVELGVAEVHRFSGSNDFHHGALQLLAQGYERLIKCTVIAAACARGDVMPKPREIGHRLTGAHREMLDMISQVDEYASRPAVKEDLGFMRHDKQLAALLDLLSRFASGGRYFDLDAIVDKDAGDPDLSPSRIWSALELEFWDSISGGLRIDEVPVDEVHARIGRAIAALFDRYSRAISRAWFLGALGPEGPAYGSGSLYEWTVLTDEQLGVPRAP